MVTAAVRRRRRRGRESAAAAWEGGGGFHVAVILPSGGSHSASHGTTMTFDGDGRATAGGRVRRRRWCDGGRRTGAAGRQREGAAWLHAPCSLPATVESQSIKEHRSVREVFRTGHVVGNVLKEANVALKFITKNSYKEFVSHNSFCLGTSVVLGNLYIVNLCGLEFLYSAFKQRETVQ